MSILTDDEILAAMTPDAVEGDYYLPQNFARAIEAAVLAKLAAKDVKPSAYITYKGHLLHADDPKVLEHSNPEPLYTEAQLLSGKLKDSERLEWLIKAQCVLIKDFDGLVFPYWHTSGRRGEAKPTFREAIDAAMEGKRNEH